MGRVISDERWRSYMELRRLGLTRTTAAKQCQISYKAAKAFEDRAPTSSGKRYAEQTRDLGLLDPVPIAGLHGPARAALDDFGLFRRRYFGRIATPWQSEAAERVVEMLDSPEKMYVVVNCPPGSGKSTLFTHDIPAWLLVRNRSLRALLGSRTERQARQYTGRLRRTLERRDRVRTDEETLRRGLGVDAAATLAEDYGRFKPPQQDLWRNDEFIVAQHAGIPIEDKEPSFAAYGMDSGFLGGRYNLVVWDDLVDKRTVRTAEAREAQQKWWEEEAETRLEPGGLLILQGQRMAADDLYRYCLNLLGDDIDIEELDDVEIAQAPRKYHHIVYRAHDEARCTGRHGRDAPAWPDGCLLDPMRLAWRELRMIQKNRSERYRVLYQQEDVDPAKVLVPKAWIDGGRQVDGEILPGCWDNDRDLCEIPKGLTGELVSIASADPSPTKFWSIQWWVYHPDTGQRFLMDLIRQSMDAPDFLDWNHTQGVFSGVMDEWQARSLDLGLPIRTWVVEANAAQRFLLQYEHVRRWQSVRGVAIIAHQTHRNKSDPEFGVQTLGPLYRFGKVRLPGKSHTAARITSLKLVDEVTRWPEGSTEDCVMAQWFVEWNLAQIAGPNLSDVRLWRPSWLYEDASPLGALALR